jgi:MoaA/NifB/PqqE/SkfB family radical SAM enzyme
MHSQEHIVPSVPVVIISASTVACAAEVTGGNAKRASRNQRNTKGFDGPRHVIWEITQSSVARGITGHSALSDEVLTTSESLSLIDELVDCGVRAVVLSGEPLARPDWWALAERAVRCGLDVEIETSGALITDETADHLAALGVARVVVSIDSHLAEEHDALRGVPGLHERAREAVRLLVARGVRVVIGFTATRRNWWDAAEVVALASALRAGAARLMEYVPGRCGRAELALHPDELRAALMTWRDLADQYRGRVDMSWWIEEPERAPFQSPGAGGNADVYLTPRIRPDGTLTPCVFSTTPIGSFRRRSLREMWTRSPLLAARQDRRRRPAPRCESAAARSSSDATGAGACSKPRCRRMVE